MNNDMIMSIATLAGGILGGLLIMGSMAVAAFVFDFVEKIIEKEEKE